MNRLRQLALALSLSLCLGYANTAVANVLGTDLQNFNPTTNGLDFVTVHSSETLKPGILNVGYFVNLAGNSLPRFFENGSENTGSDQILGGDFNLGMGLTRNWDFGISLPHTISQEIHGEFDTVLQYEQTGLTEIRLNTKYRLWGDDAGGGAMIASANIHNTENNPFLGENPGPTFNLEMAADTTVGKFSVAGNLGYRFRDAGEPIPNSDGKVLIQPFRDQWIWSVAANYLFPSIDTKLIFEIFASLPAEKVSFTSDRQLKSTEALLGIKHDISQNLAFHFGGGTEISHSVATPDWRVYTGLNWAMGPLWGNEKSKPIKRRRRKRRKQAEPEEESAPITVQDLLPAEDLDSSTPTQEVENFFIPENIGFNSGSGRLKEQAAEVINSISDHLEKGGGFELVVIKGHTDSIGSNSYNFDLSLKRAKAVETYLNRNKGIPLNKIWILGFGEREPVADNGNYQGRAMNRRVEFEIIRTGATAKERRDELGSLYYQANQRISKAVVTKRMKRDCFLRKDPEGLSPTTGILKKGKSYKLHQVSGAAKWSAYLSEGRTSFVFKNCTR